VSEKQYTKLIRHHKIATVEYTTDEGQSNYPMPRGLEKHDVYIIEQEQQKQEPKEEVVRDNLDKFKIYNDDQNPYII
jgi:hypothetical protein